MPVGTRPEAAVQGARSPRARCLNLYGKDKKNCVNFEGLYH